MSLKKKGFRHLFSTVIYAFDGLKILTQETAFRHEVIFLCCILSLFAFFNVAIHDYMIALMLWLILIAFEAINTAIEQIIDKISPQISDFAKHAKDLGSLAVCCMICVNIIFVGLVLF